jgi:uncharacterized protein (DUF362 family)
MNGFRPLTRRDLIRATLAGGALAALRPTSLARAVQAVAGVAKSPARVALTTGADHAQMIFQSLVHIKDAVARAIGDRPVVIKPNNVAIDRLLAATPPESIEGILEFLKSIGKDRNVIIAESAANGPTFEGFSNYGYTPLAQKYGAKLVDLDQSETGLVRVVDQKDLQPHAVRVAKLLLDRNVFVISAAKIKTHDRVVATLSLKNIVVGAPVKHVGFRWGPGSKPGAWSDKPIIHGNGFHGLQYNLYAMAGQLRPDLAVIDGYEAMEGNGPTAGTPVPHRVAVSSLDWLAADRVAVALMGIDIARMGYLNYCAAAGMGEIDLARMEILGERVADHVRTYKLANNIDKQLQWMKPLAEEG